nr:DUF4112 domain-containing protein [Mesorhizobium liriopis]
MSDPFGAGRVVRHEEEPWFSVKTVNPTQSESFFRQPPDRAATLARLDKLSRLMDAAFRVPVIGTRIGADAFLNLVPGAGPLVSQGMSAWLVWEARRLGVPKSVLLRMLANVGVDLAIGLVPVAGWIGDVFFRANLRNMALLREHLAENPGAPTHASNRRDPNKGRDWNNGPVIEAEPVR